MIGVALLVAAAPLALWTLARWLVGDWPRPLSRRDQVRRSLVFWGVVGAIAWLDRAGGVDAQHAAVVGWVVIALEWIWRGIEAVGTYIAVSLEGVVVWLVNSFGWIANVVGTFMKSAGALFARLWDGLSVLWSRILKPALLWLDNHIERLRAWLIDTWGPVFRWLRRVRDFLTDLYARFVRPVLDTIDFIRQLDRLLQQFHIDVLKGLDDTLTKIEQRIDDAFKWVFSKLAEITNWINIIVTADGFFQRYTLLRSEWRYIVDRWRLLVIARHKPLSDQDRQDNERRLKVKTPSEITRGIIEYLETGGGPEAALIDEEYQQWLIDLRG